MTYQVWLVEGPKRRLRSRFFAAKIAGWVSWNHDSWESDDVALEEAKEQVRADRMAFLRRDSPISFVKEEDARKFLKLVTESGGVAELRLGTDPGPAPTVE